MIGICDICRYGQTDKCTNPNRDNPRECFVSHTGTTIAEKRIRAEVIEECLVLVDTIMPPEPYLLKSKHYENWKMKTMELRMLRDMLKQLKEQEGAEE